MRRLRKAIAIGCVAGATVLALVLVPDILAGLVIGAVSGGVIALGLISWPGDDPALNGDLAEIVKD